LWNIYLWFNVLIGSWLIASQIDLCIGTFICVFDL
jgi:hypothetical protein